MKRFIFVILALLMTAGIACADCPVQVTYAESSGPNWDHTDCFVDGVIVDTATAVDPGICDFTVVALTGQVITLEAFNSQGGGSGLYTAGSLLAAPAQPGGPVNINIGTCTP